MKLRPLKYLFHKSYREWWKWRKNNLDNNTELMHYYNHPYVHVGKKTYGMIDVRTYGKTDRNLYIGNYCSIANDVTFHLSPNHHLNRLSTFPFGGDGENSVSKGDIVVDDDVWIGHHATILTGVHIGQGAVVAAGAVVSKDVPPYAIVGGVPAKIIKYRFSVDIINKLMNLDYAKMDDEFVEQYRDLFRRDIVAYPETVDEILMALEKKE